jgi:hypothetical protein
MLEACPGCGAYFPPLEEAPTHRYIGASAGCWALYTPLVAGCTPDAELLASSRVQDMKLPVPVGLKGIGGLLADAYAAQHHGDASPQAIQSVAVHLLTLHGVLERGVNPAQAQWVRLRALRKRGVFRRLEPPPLGAALTIRHLFVGGGIHQPCSADDYVASVYATWATLHGPQLVGWYAAYVLVDY